MKKNYTALVTNKQKPAMPFGFLLLLSLMILGIQAYSQQTYSFTTAGATSSLGPTQIQVNNAYTLTNLQGNVTVIGQGMQTWTCPVAGLYRIEAYGAQGGASHGANPGANGGLGAIMMGEFNLAAGQVFTIVVGQKGGSTGYGGGGGGGSYVMTGVNIPLCVAGGGGGAYGYQGDARGCNPGYPGLTATAGGTSNVPGGPTYGYTAPGPGGGAPGYGGVNGYGGGSGVASGGGGVLGDGANGGAGSSIYCYAGKSFVNGSTGGGGTTALCNGGFGGGGGAQAGTGYGAGGGGYSGGGGGSLVGNPLVSGNGGGGGSYNAGSNQNNTAGANSNDGKVIIVELCTISLTASGSNSLNPSICAGQSLTLTTDAVSNYSWSTGASTQSIVVSPLVTTLYTLSAMSVSNCITTRSINVIVSGGQPTLSVVSSTNQTCLGKTATLTASGAVTYTWTNGVTNGVSFNPSSTQTYTVTGQNGCGSAQAFATISITPLPITAAITSTAVCTNKTATITATGSGNSYTWQPLNITGNSTVQIVNPQVTTVYTISVSDGTCSGSTTIALQANPIPTISVAATTSIVCPGGTVGLSATGGNNYTWTPGPLTGSNISVSPAISTLYSVVGDNNFGCLNTAQQVIVAGAQPTMALTVNNLTICSGDAATITVSGANTYAWSNGPTSTLNIVNPGVSTTYTVTGTNTASGCSNQEVITISVFSPVVSITGNTAVCIGNSASLNASGIDTYTWNPGGTPFASILVTPLVNTTYTVNGTATLNSITCPVEGTIEVIVNPVPTITTTSVKPAICAKESNVYTASGASTYTWASATGTSSGASYTVTSNVATILVYTVSGTNAQGCENNIAIPVNIYACTGVEQQHVQSRLEVYPNPSRGEFVVSSDTDMTLDLINQLGQTIKQIQLNALNDHQVSVPELPNGIYFIVGKNLSGKIIVAK